MADVFSKQLYPLGLEDSDDKEIVLKKTHELFEDKEFRKKNRGKGFTLLFAGYEEFRKEIEAIIIPKGGKMIIDEYTVELEMAPL